MPALPLLTPENTAFFTGGENGELLITFCDDCEGAIHPPQIVCPHCLSDRVASRAVAGTGTVYTYTINHQQWMPGMEVPFALAVVDVDGAPGVRVSAKVVGTDPADVAIGQRMAVSFEHIEDVWLPQWEPVQ